MAEKKRTYWKARFVYEVTIDAENQLRAAQAATVAIVEEIPDSEIVGELVLVAVEDTHEEAQWIRAPTAGNSGDSTGNWTTSNRC